MTIDEIEPGRLYSLSEASKLIPSSRAGKPLARQTLRRWAEEGSIRASPRKVGQKTAWFFWGAEILRFLRAAEAPAWEGRTPTQRRRADAAARKKLIEMGCRLSNEASRARE